MGFSPPVDGAKGQSATEKQPKAEQIIRDAESYLSGRPVSKVSTRASSDSKKIPQKRYEYTEVFSSSLRCTKGQSATENQLKAQQTLPCTDSPLHGIPFSEKRLRNTNRRSLAQVENSQTAMKRPVSRHFLARSHRGRCTRRDRGPPHEAPLQSRPGRLGLGPRLRSCRPAAVSRRRSSELA